MDTFTTPFTDPRFGFAGGGGSSSGGGGGSSSSGSSYYSGGSSGSGGTSDEGSFLAVIIFMAIMVVIAIISSKQTKKKQLQKLARNNSTPEEKQIHAQAEEIFKQYQADWTNFNFENLQTYTTKDYCQHATLMLQLLQNLHRVNKVSQLQVHAVYLLDHVDSATPLPAHIRVEFEFSGLDEVEDTTSHQTLYKNHASHIHETWNFIYDREGLHLAGISQPTESAPHLVKSLQAFAQENHLFYSPDWGRYALPARGLIFGGATMRVADINNHIIGQWSSLQTSPQKSTQYPLLIQLYTYAEQPGAPNTYYLVGQITVPKEYLGVIVKSKKYKTHHKPDKSYQKFELEWPDFNQRYDVYAAKRDALPAFELLNPQFMAYLYDKNLHYNLEVVDNSIYIFANVKHATEQDYAELLDILSLAHKELKM